MEKKFRHYSVFLYVLAVALCFFVLFRFSDVIRFVLSVIRVFEPILSGFVIAYVLNPAVCFFERRLYKMNNAKKIRITAVFFTLGACALFLYVLFYMMIPQIYLSVVKLTEEFPSRLATMLGQFDSYVSEYTGNTFAAQVLDTIYEYQDVWTKNTLPDKMSDAIAYILKSVRGALRGVANIGIGVVVSVYVLLEKESFAGQSKKMLYALFPKKFANGVMAVVRKSNRVFSAFLAGKTVGSILQGLICFVFMKITRMPYSLLISILIGVSNMIPVFGPVIGGVVGAFLILLIDPVMSIYFVLFLIVLQMIDANIIEPRLLGERTGLSAFWVVTSIVAGGAFFGFWGLLTGVPVFAVIYYFIKCYIEQRLKSKNLPETTRAYVGLEKIGERGEVWYFGDNGEGEGYKKQK